MASVRRRTQSARTWLRRLSPKCADKWHNQRNVLNARAPKVSPVSVGALTGGTGTGETRRKGDNFNYYLHVSIFPQKEKPMHSASVFVFTFGRSFAVRWLHKTVIFERQGAPPCTLDFQSCTKCRTCDEPPLASAPTVTTRGERKERSPTKKKNRCIPHRFLFLRLVAASLFDGCTKP